jgi:hypothetical protein
LIDGTWTKTNVVTRISQLIRAGRQRENRIMKL